jgi:predicted phage tail protein
MCTHLCKIKLVSQIIDKMNKMKKSIFAIAIATLMVSTMLTGCESSGKKIENAQDKVQNAQDKVVVANQELNQVIKDSIQQFRKESEDRIAENEKSIAEFRAKIAKENKENRTINEQKLAVLEQQNRDMKTRLEGFRDDSKDKWDDFRFKFKHDMDNLGQAFKAFVVKRK